MGNMERLQICFSSDEKVRENNDYNLDRIIFDLDSQVELLSSQTDNFDYLISIASGVLCGALDILWSGDFDLDRGRASASDKIDEFVKKTAKMLGCEEDDLKSCVNFLEKNFQYQVMEIHLILVGV